jgi:hypothetical protein
MWSCASTSDKTVGYLKSENTAKSELKPSFTAPPSDLSRAAIGRTTDRTIKIGPTTRSTHAHCIAKIRTQRARAVTNHRCLAGTMPGSASPLSDRVSGRRAAHMAARLISCHPRIHQLSVLLSFARLKNSLNIHLVLILKGDFKRSTACDKFDETCFKKART